MKLLFYGESPFLPTGASQVTKQLLPALQRFFSDIHIVAINQVFPVDDLPTGLTLTCAPKEDMIATKEARQAIAKCDYDCLFLTTDINRITDLKPEISLAKQAGIPIIMYAAMDCHVFVREFWDVLLLASVPVVFSDWCYRQAVRMIPELASNLRVIYHGCEPDVFYPLPEQERKKVRNEIFSIFDDHIFLVVNVNRNQVRKDLARTMAAFHLFHIEHPNSLLYLHAKQKDLGGNLPTQAAYLGLEFRGENAEIVFAPDTLHELAGISREELNLIYNAADVCISTSTGEGWGLTTTEAMAAGTPFIGPDNTTFPEILGKIDFHSGWKWNIGKRGLLVQSGGPDLWTMFYGISDTPREIVSTTGMRNALLYAYSNRRAMKRYAEEARKWTLEHTWKHKQGEWVDLLEKVLYA
jgi:glycosyltransferase involved in cell wall biosynthesis